MTNSRYEIKKFTPTLDGDKPDDAASHWIDAVGLGFHGRRETDAHKAAAVRRSAADGKVMTGVYDTQAPPEAAPGPVGTFVGYGKTLNVGGALLPAYLISAVTVRPTHRRRGILRSMMTDGLAGAAAAGTPMAALTASEGAIYRRFGFGCAVNKKTMTVETAQSFGMLVPAPGSVEIVDAAKLRDIGPAVFDKYHRAQTGSIGRQGDYAAIISGELGDNGEPDPAVRAALHYGRDGDVDGYVSYKFAGWNSSPAAIELVDLIALNPGAYRGLWEFLGGIDLVTQVKIPGALGNDLLAASLVDARAVKTTEDRDHLWLRFLDTAACLEAREYGADGVLTFSVDDALGYAAGTYRLEVAGGRGHVSEQPADTPSDIELDVADLSAIYLGAVSPLTLIDAGRITVAGADAADTLRAVFAATGSVWCTTEF